MTHREQASEPSSSIGRTDIRQETRAQLEQDFQLLFRAVANARNGIIITDCSQPDDPIIYANQAFEQLSGYNQSEVIGHNCRFMQGPQTDPEAPKSIRSAIEAGDSIRIEIRNYRKDGTPFWNDLLISPIFDDAGTVTHFVGNQLDVTVRKEAEVSLLEERNLLAQRVEERTALLNESRNYLASVVETVREPFVILDQELRVVSANKAFYTTFRTTPEETEQIYVFNLGNKQWNILRLKNLLEELLSTGSPFEDVVVEHDFPRVGRRIMLLNARQVELEGSKQQRILLAFEDITERRSAEMASLRDTALTNAILGSLSAHIAVIDKHGVIIAVNDAWRRFAVEGGSDVQANSFVGVNYLDVLRSAPPEDGIEAPEALRGIEAVLSNKQSNFSLEYPCDTPTAQLWFLLQVTPLKHESGGAVVAHIDITDRKHIEQRKDDFISMASHELKTPITSLKIVTQLLRRQLVRAGVDAMTTQLDKMNAQIDRLTRLVQDMLDVSRVTSGKLTIKREPFNINDLVGSVSEDFQTTTNDHAIVLRGAVSRLVIGDADRVEQVILNLLSNAVKYSPKGQPIDITLEERPRHVVISVRDRGVGIEPQHQAMVFDRFYQVNDSTVQTYPGLGMGLYICRQIIEHHHGEIWVESTKGQGAMFRFTLPFE